MATVTHLAKISRRDYPAFVRLPGSDFSGSYDDWLQLERKQEAHYREQHNDIVWLKVNPDEFAEFCRARGAPCNKSNLYSFVLPAAG